MRFAGAGHPSAGFTIARLAVTLPIVAVALGRHARAFRRAGRAAKISDTERILEQARETLMGFACGDRQVAVPRAGGQRRLRKFAAGGTSRTELRHFLRFSPCGDARFHTGGQRRLRDRRLGHGAQPHTLRGVEPDGKRGNKPVHENQRNARRDRGATHRRDVACRL